MQVGDEGGSGKSDVRSCCVACQGQCLSQDLPPPPPLCPWGAAVTVAAAAVAVEVVILKELETQLTN